MFNPRMYLSDPLWSNGKQRKIDFVLNRKIFVKKHPSEMPPDIAYALGIALVVPPHAGNRNVQ